MVHQADLLDLVDDFGIVETHEMGPDRKLLIVSDHDSLLRNVHPGSVFRAEV
jgi:hypothetical protein